MRYPGSFAKKERERIFRLFLHRTTCKFSEMEKETHIRSNLLAYHLERMRKQGLLEKQGEQYSLAKNSEKYIPILSHIVGEEQGPLPVVLVAIMRRNKMLMIRRNKRPYKDYWSMVGGKMRMEESFAAASLRLVKERTNIDAKFLSINGVLHERIEGDSLIKHSFILFFTKVRVKEEKFRESDRGMLRWFTRKELEQERVIPSDLWLIKNRLSAETDVKSATMHEEKGELSSFRIIA